MRVPIDQIEVPHPRKTYIRALAQSIRDVGLMHPILVRPHEGHFRLISGSRRLAAITSLGLDEVPVTVVTDAPTALTVMKAENFGPCTVPMVWSERAAQVSELLALEPDPAWTGSRDFGPLEAICRALGTSRSTIRRVQEVVAEAAKGHPVAVAAMKAMDGTGAVMPHWRAVRKLLADNELATMGSQGVISRRAIDVADRRAKVKALHDKGWNQGEIAQELGISRHTVLNDLRSMQVETRVGSTPSNSTKILERLVSQLNGSKLALDMIDPSDLRIGPEEAARWENDLRRFRSALSPIYRAIKHIKESNR